MSTRQRMTNAELAESIAKIRARASELLAKNSVTLTRWQKFSDQLTRRKDFVQMVREAAVRDAAFRADFSPANKRHLANPSKP